MKIKIRFGKNGWGGKVQGGTTSSLPEEAGLRSQGNDVGTMANPAINDSAAFPAIDDSAACPPATFPAVKPRRKHNRTIAAKPPVAKPAIDDSAAFPAINDSASCPPATFPTVKPRRKCNRTITAKPQNKRIRPTKQPMSQDDSNSTLPATFPAVKARIKPVRLTAEQISQAAFNLTAGIEPSRPAETPALRPALENKPSAKRGRPRKNTCVTSKTFQPAPLNDEDWNRIEAHYWRSVQEEDGRNEAAEGLCGSSETASKAVDVPVQERKGKAKPKQKSTSAN